jgi:hypothetical protein
VTAIRVDFSLQQPFSKGVGCWSNCRGRCEVQVEIERVVFEVGYLDVSEAFKSKAGVQPRTSRDLGLSA